MPKEISYEEGLILRRPVMTSPHLREIRDVVDPAHLLQVIRDMDRRITDLERQAAKNG